MVRVPRISDNRVQDSGVPSARVTTSFDEESFGSGASARRRNQAVEQTLQISNKLAEKEIEKANNAKAIDSAAQLSEFENSFMDDALRRRGKNSFSLPKEFDKKFKEKSDEIRGSLANDTQRLRFDQMSLQYKNSMINRINSHVRSETFTYYSEKNKILVENEIRAASNSFDDPSRIALSLERQEASIEAFGKDNGLPKELIKAQKFDAKSRTHVAVIENLISSDSNSAVEYFNANKSEINRKNLDLKSLKSGIKAFQDENIKAIEESLDEKILDESITQEDVLQFAQPIENGGIGFKKVNSYLDKIKKIQNGKVSALTKSDEDSEKYINLVNRFVTDAEDSFTFKKILVDAWSDGFLDNEERKDLKALKDRFEQIEKEINPAWFSNPIKAFQNFHKTDADSERDKDIALSLKSLIHRISRGDDPEEAVQTVNRSDVIKKHPQRSGYEVGKVYTEQGIKFRFNGFISVDDMDVEVIE